MNEEISTLHGMLKVLIQAHGSVPVAFCLTRPYLSVLVTSHLAREMGEITEQGIRVQGVPVYTPDGLQKSVAVMADGRAINL